MSSDIKLIYNNCKEFSYKSGRYAGGYEFLCEGNCETMWVGSTKQNKGFSIRVVITEFPKLKWENSNTVLHNITFAYVKYEILEALKKNTLNELCEICIDNEYIERPEIKKIKEVEFDVGYTISL